MPTIHTQFEQRSAAWHNIRLGIPTASEFDRIITPTGKPSKQAAGYLHRLLAEWILGESLLSEYESPWMQHGRDCEEAAVSAFEFQTGLPTSPVGFVTRLDGMVGCSPDRLIEGGIPLEIKCPAPNTQVCRLLSGGSVEDDYKCQVQGEIWLCEADKNHVVSYHPRLPLIHTEVGRDKQFIKLLAGAVDCFVVELLDKREQLERRFGPFVRPEPKARKQADDFEGFGVTEADIDLFLRA